MTRLSSLWNWLVRVFTFSVGHDALWPKRNISVCVEGEEITVVRAYRFLSWISVTGVYSFPVEDGPEFCAARAIRAIRDWGSSSTRVTLVVPLSWVISRSVEMPATVKETLARAVEFELDRLTPLNPGNALYDYSVLSETNEKISLFLAVSRADAISPYIAAFRERGVTVDRVTAPVACGPDYSGTVHKDTALAPAVRQAVIDSLWPKAQNLDLLARGQKKTARPPLLFTILLLLVIGGLAAAWAIIPLTTEEKRTAEIDRQIKALKEPVKKVEQLKKEVALREKEIATIEKFKKDRVRAIDLVKELTKVLPKTAYLTRVRTTDTMVDLEGYAGSAAEILPKLEASPLLKKAEFASPTFRDTRLNADRFVIKAEIESEKVKGEIKK
jgi:general secretion pathway protein L